jgi:hypothetical protein
MNHKSLLLIAALVPSLSLASVEPFHGQYLILDRVFAAVGAESSRRVALEILEHVAEGHPDSVSEESASQVGLKTTEFQEFREAYFKDSSVRVRALLKIGDTALPEAVQYLSSLTPTGLSADDSHQVWPAAQVALRQALLTRIPDAQGKIEFLENTLVEPHDAVSNSGVTNWTIQALCNRGSLTSLPMIQKSLFNSFGVQRAQEEMQFCESRMRVVSGDPDRTKALASVLTIDGGIKDQRLTSWAIYQLASMHSSKADAELKRYSAAIEKLPAGFPDKEHLRQFSGAIRSLRPELR